jgi:Predicted pyridoxal phosphate-dependent enzyme apparently involved in regulation of cell wall biogenesis
MKKKYKFQLLEDNCETLGSIIDTKSLGSYGLASSHSFYIGHHISTIEGGMVSSSDKKFYNIACAIRAHGWSRDMQQPFKKKLEKKFKVDEFKSFFTFYYSGYNIRSNDLNATLGVEQLKKLNKISKIRHLNFYKYKSNLKDFWCQKSKLSLISSFGYATFVKNRLEVFKYLKSKKIQTRPLICGNMGQQPFLKKRLIKNNDLQNSNKVDKFGIYLPNHANLRFKDIDYVTKIFKEVAIPFNF